MIAPPRSKFGIRRGTEPVARITDGASDLGRAAVGERHGDDTTGTEPAGSVEHLDLAVLAHAGDAADQRVDDLLLALLGDREVDGRGAGLDAELAGVVDVPEHGSRLEERLGRDAPAVEARAAETVLLDECHLHPG